LAVSQTGESAPCQPPAPSADRLRLHHHLNNNRLYSRSKSRRVYDNPTCYVLRFHSLGRAVFARQAGQSWGTTVREIVMGIARLEQPRKPLSNRANIVRHLRGASFKEI
jgi:hypothetical protein